MYRWISNLRRADEAAFFWCHHWSRQRFSAAVPLWISRSGDGYGYVLVCLFAYLLGDPDAELLLLTLLAGFLIELPLYWVLKNTCRRQRPYQRNQFAALIVASDQFSFPSGHTTAAFMFATLTSAYMPSLAWLMYLWAAVIGGSRVMLGVHYPTDIAAGAVLGIGLGWLVISVSTFWLG